VIDLHAHILPGMDDGAKNLKHSLEISRLYRAAGYTTVVATPHAPPESPGRGLAKSVALQVENLNQAIQHQRIGLKLLTGMEIPLAPEVSDLLDQGRVLPLGDTHWVLLEPPFERLPLYWEQILFEVASRGYRVLLAHPERCLQLCRTRAMFDRLFETGIHLQVNWGSFLGLYGREALRTARYLAFKGYIHCLATDSHDTQARSPAMVRRAAAAVAQLAGRKNLARLAIENPAHLLRDDPLLAMAPVPVKPSPAQRVGHKLRQLFG
jgi:protein-tyrosine phosphatase